MKRRHLPRVGCLAFLLVVSGLSARATEATVPIRFRVSAGGGGESEFVRLVANRDDDDRDGLADADDDQVNGPDDLGDLAAVVVAVADPQIVDVLLESDSAVIVCFRQDGDGWRKLAADEAVLLPAGQADFMIECQSWATATPAWDGRASITAVGRDAAGQALARAVLQLEVAPVMLVPETAAVHEVYVARGRYDNEAFLARLRSLLEVLAVPLRVHDAGVWQEMWMQDTMELGATAAPGAACTTMAVVLGGLRGFDPYPETLLGPDLAVARLAAPRPLGGGDAWADWYGNLMVSPATKGWPQGRVIYGRNVVTGAEFHPDVIGFLAAQQVQSPVWIDTSWLLIKHVDEIVAFLPGRDGRGCLLVVDPVAGLDQARAAGLVAAVGPGRETFAETNRRIATAIEEMLTGVGPTARAGAADGGDATGGLLGLLGWEPSRVVRLPVAFEIPGELPEVGLTDATSLWSNPVNMLFVNGTVLCGDAGMPPAVREACRVAFLAAGVEQVEFLDDTCYQRMKGNVHCATNSRRHLLPVRTSPEDR
jgi:protein-arginine deiminase